MTPLVTMLLAGCGCFVLISIAAILLVFFFFGLADGETNSSEVQSSTGSAYTLEEDVELVDLLIDGGCKTGEQFTEEDEACTLPITCDDITTCIQYGDTLVSKLETQYGSLTAEEAVATDEETTVLLEYDVDLDNEQLVTDFALADDVLEYDSSLWYSFAWLIPEHARTDITRFEVFESGDTLAYVYLHDDYGVEWTFGMNRNNIELASETMVTYIHEYAHLLSLRNTEVNYFVYEHECEDLYLDDSCFYMDSYVADFYRDFYASDTYDYTSDYFISDYAMSNVVEDFAESFAHFVLSPYEEGETMAAQKLAFFYNYEYLVNLRAEILGRVATWLDRTVEPLEQPL